MSAKEFVEIACDKQGCGRHFTHSGTAGAVRDAMVTFGWTYAHPGRDYCPIHSPKPAGEPS